MPKKLFTVLVILLLSVLLIGQMFSDSNKIIGTVPIVPESGVVYTGVISNVTESEESGKANLLLLLEDGKIVSFLITQQSVIRLENRVGELIVLGEESSVSEKVTILMNTQRNFFPISINIVEGTNGEVATITDAVSRSQETNFWFVFAAFTVVSLLLIGYVLYLSVRLGLLNKELKILRKNGKDSK